MLDKATIEEMRAYILGEKDRLESELGSFAKENPQAEGGFESKWENLGNSEEDNAVEVAEYINTIGVERELEARLGEMRQALERVDNGTYGVCANCGQDIPPARLKIKPEAIYCIPCSEKLQR